MAEFQELTSILKDLLTNRFAPKPNFIRGLLGDGLGNVKVSGKGKEDKSFVRFNRSATETFEIFNKEVNPVDNWPVLIGELPGQPGLIQVVGTDWSVYEQTSWGESVGGLDKHAPTHEWPEGSPGSDPLNVYIRSIAPLKSFSLGSGSTQVFVSSFNYEYISTGTVWSGVPGIELGQGASTTPATGTQRMMGIYHNPQLNQLFGVTGSTIPFTLALEPPRPAFPAGVNPSAWIRLYGGQNTIAESDIFDARQLFGGYPPTGPAFGDLTGSYPNPQVQGILNFPIEGSLSDNDILQFSGSSWTLGPVALTGLAGGDLTGSYPNPQVQGLLGFPIQGTLDDNDTLQFSGSSWSLGAPGETSGWPFTNILTVSTTDLDADHNTIAAAISAASAGDIILLDAETWTGGAFAVDVTKSLTLMGLSPETILTSTSTETVKISATDVTIRDLTIENTGTGTNSNCISDNFFAANNLVVQNCILNKVSGAATISRGFRNTGSTGWRIDNCQVIVTAGTTKYGYGADTAASSAKIINGSIEGSTDDINLNHASASIELNDPVLENDDLTVTLGSATGWYLDGSGNRRAVGADLDINGNDIILDADADTKIDMSGGDDIIRINTAGNKAVEINAAGIITQPLQSSFLAHNSVTDLNLTGDLTQVTVEFDTEIFDQNNDFNTTTDTFTAPVTGKYLLSVCLSIIGITSSHDRVQVFFNTSSRPYNSIFQNAFNIAGPGPQIILRYTALADMAASDTATVELIVGGGAKVVDVTGGANVNTSFAGSLIN